MRLKAETNIAALAGQPLFAPLRAALLCCTAGLPDLDQFNARLLQGTSRPGSGGGAPLRFVAPDGGAQTLSQPYEERIFLRGEVVTRAGNWHDFFNALIWLHFPRAKAALNARHYAELSRQRKNRGAVRDAATQYDESGLVIVALGGESASLLQLLKTHQWKTFFWERRAQVARDLRFIVFGHALYDKLRAPYAGLCGKALIIELPASWKDLPPTLQLERVDQALAKIFSHSESYTNPRDFQPLPLLGIPGVTTANAEEKYYEDARQFRPARPAKEAA